MNSENPYPKGSLLEWVYDKLMSDERYFKHLSKEMEDAQQNIARWRQLLEILGAGDRES